MAVGAAAVGAAALLGGCGAPASVSVTGHYYLYKLRSGLPYPGNRPAAGTITMADAGSTRTLRVGKSGRLSFSAPPGLYLVVTRCPQDRAPAVQDLTVRAHRPNHWTLVCEY